MFDSGTDLPWCPSAQPDMDGSIAFGIVGGTASEPRVGYLARPQPVTIELLDLAQPVRPTEVFRFAAPCAREACRHFDGEHCQLGARTVELLEPVVGVVPPCPIRSRCRWWKEQGREACLRCPQVVTRNYLPSAAVQQAALPPEERM